jgi:CheY-like chemotaxis protein
LTGKKEGNPNMPHILIIDDEPPIRLMLSKLFKSEGYTVSEASNGQEGLAKFNETPTDLIIIDIFMPEKEGIETIMELRGIHPDVKIVAMSGGGRNATNTYLHMAESLGANRTIEKPIRRDVLLEIIRSLI